MKVVIIACLLILPFALLKTDPENDYLLVYANLTAPDNEILLLEDTKFDYIRENLKNFTKEVRVCKANGVEGVDKCIESTKTQNNLTILSTNIKAKELLKQIEKASDHAKAFLFFQNETTLKDYDADTTPQFVLGIDPSEYRFFDHYDLDNDVFMFRHYLGYNCPVVKAGFFYSCFVEICWVLLMLQLALSVYKFYKHQVVCFHRLFLYIVAIKGLIDLCTWAQQITCSEFYDPSLLLLIKKSMSSIFQSFLAAVVIGLSYVLILFTWK